MTTPTIPPAAAPGPVPPAAGPGPGPNPAAPLRVAFLLPGNFIGGGVFFVFEHARRLAAGGHEVCLVLADPRAPRRIDRYAGMEGVEVCYLAEARHRPAFDLAVATAWRTAYQVTDLPARRYGYLVQDDERRFAADRPTAEVLFAEQTYADDFVFFSPTRWLQRMLRDEFGRPAYLVPYAVSFERVRGQTPWRPRTPGRLRVLVEGRGAEPRKRIPFTFDVLRDFPDVEVFYAAADGYKAPEWRVDAFFTRVPYDRMGAIYASCDVLVKLSSQESFSLPVLETFACGGTAVVTNFTGHDEYLVDGANALVVPIDDRAAAVAAIERLRDDPALRARLQAGAAATCERFSFDESHRQLLAACAEVRASAAAAPPQELARVRRVRPMVEELERVRHPDARTLATALARLTWRRGRAAWRRLRPAAVAQAAPAPPAAAKFPFPSRTLPA